MVICGTCHGFKWIREKRAVDDWIKPEKRIPCPTCSSEIRKDVVAAIQAQQLRFSTTYDAMRTQLLNVLLARAKELAEKKLLVRIDGLPDDPSRASR